MIEIHDYVAVLTNIKGTPVKRGTTGTVVSGLSDTHYLVEFSDSDGQVYEQLPIHENDLNQITENLEAG